jgi:hypothetical protein
MSITKKNQKLQVRQSQTYDDTLNPTSAETASSDLETDLNYLRSQLKQIIGEPDWFSVPPTNLKSISLITGIDRLILYYTTELVKISVPLTRNYIELSNLGDFPSVNMAINSDTKGAPVAVLATNTGVSHSLAISANEENLLLIRDADTNDKILDTNGEIVYGLLQVDVNASDDVPFQATGNNSAQISFVSRNPITETFQAAEIDFVEGRDIEYSYKNRQSFTDLPEDFTIQALDFLRTPHYKEIEVSLTVATDGDTSFLLPKPFIPNGTSVLKINGVDYYRTIHYSITGIVLTWTDVPFILETDDELLLRYQIS